MGVLLIGAPAIHIQLHGGKCLPLEITNIDCFILAAEDAVHIRTDVGLSGKAGTDISRYVETDIFPYAACLVARPDSGITLRACPAVKRDDERTGVVAIIRHNASHISHTVQSERVSGSHPGNVGFQYTYTCVTHFFHDVALQQSAYTFFRMQVGLCPKSDFHSVLTGVIAQAFQVGDVTVQRFRLSVAGSVTIVG